jgi:hypothetical protein
MNRVLNHNLNLDRYAPAAELDIKIDEEEEKPVEEAKTEEVKTEEVKTEEPEIKLDDVVKIEDLNVESVKHDDL